MKKLLAAVSILGVADFFVHNYNELMLHDSGIENATIMVALICGLISVLSLLYIVDKEQREQEKSDQEERLNIEMRKAAMDLLRGDGINRGQNPPAAKQQIRKGA